MELREENLLVLVCYHYIPQINQLYNSQHTLKTVKMIMIFKIWLSQWTNLIPNGIGCTLDTIWIYKELMLLQYLET